MTRDKEHENPGRRRAWKRAAITLVVSIVLAPWIASLVVLHPRVKSGLLRRMEASFGRPVEVSYFGVGLLGGLRIHANYVTVAEDPHFSNEFFLRAEQITASIRWTALLRGRLEFGNLSLGRPSMNLVRDSAGHWNLISWLPPTGAVAQQDAQAATKLPKLYRIEVEGARINFKQGADKHPFALTGVTGSFAQTASGNWQMDFVAQAFRAGVIAQTPGEIRVRGAIGGPRSRVLPADLTVTWDQAAAADVLRLVWGRDFGVRGKFGGEVRVQSPAAEQAAEEWSIAGSARVQGLHSWALPPRASDPAMNVRVDAAWWPAAQRVELRNGLVETTNSNLQAVGDVIWARGAAERSSVRIASGQIDFADAFAVYRAFRADVPVEAVWEGMAGLDAELARWPLRMKSLVMASRGGRLHLPGGGDPLVFGGAVMRYDPLHERLALAPVTIALRPEALSSAQRFAAAAASLRFEGSIRTRERWEGEWRLTGQARSVEPIQAAGAALGLYSTRAFRAAGWEMDGPADVRMGWRTRFFPPELRSEGSIEVRGARVNSPLFARPVATSAVRFEFGEGLRIRVSDAEAFGGRWSGTLISMAPGAWELALSTPRLDIAAFDRQMRAQGEANAHGLLAAVQPAVNTLGPTRLRGVATVNPQLARPMLEPVRAADVSLDALLEVSARRQFQLRGPLGALEVTAMQPQISQR